MWFYFELILSHFYAFQRNIPKNQSIRHKKGLWEENPLFAWTYYGASKTLDHKCEPPNVFLILILYSKELRVIPQITKSTGRADMNKFKYLLILSILSVEQHGSFEYKMNIITHLVGVLWRLNWRLRAFIFISFIKFKYLLILSILSVEQHGSFEYKMNIITHLVGVLWRLNWRLRAFIFISFIIAYCTAMTSTIFWVGAFPARGGGILVFSSARGAWPDDKLFFFLSFLSIREMSNQTQNDGYH